MRVGGQLYKLDFSSGKSYIGITHRCSEDRYQPHVLCAIKRGKGAVYQAWRKYGAPRLTVLAIIERYLLRETEARAVRVFGTLSPSGYNMTPGGDFNPMTLPEIARRAAASNTGKKRPDVAGAKNPMHRPQVAVRHRLAVIRGLSHPEVRAKFTGINNGTKRPEVRAKISAAKKGWVPSSEWRVKVSTRMRGYNPSDETRAKLAAAAKGRKQSPETIAKRLATFRNPEVRAKLASNLGKTFSVEHRAKLSANNAMRRPEVVAKFLGDNHPRWGRNRKCA